MNVKKTLLSGMLYNAMAKYSLLIVNFIITAILARILTPEQFGTVAIATVFMSFFTSLTTVGISPAIVQNKELTEEDYRGLNTATWIVALVLSGLFILSVPVFSKFFDYGRELEIVLYLLSLCIFFSVAAIVPNALLLKAKSFKVIAIRSVVVQVLTGIGAVIYALCGGGMYALLVNPILGNFFILIINYFCRPVSFSLNLSACNKIVSFASYQMLFNLVYLIYREVDKFCIGKVLGATALGYYEKSYRLMLMPLTNISSVISPVLHPVLSEYQNDIDYIRQAYVKMLRMLSEIGCVLSLLLFSFADIIILLFFGDQWSPAIPVFQTLSLSVVFQIIQTPIGAVMQSLNKVKSLVSGSVVVLASLVLCLGVGLITRNLVITASMVSFAYFVGFVGYSYFINKALQLPAKELVKNIAKPLIVYTSLLVPIIIGMLCFQQYSIQRFITNTIVILVGIFVVYKTNCFPESSLLIKKTINRIKNKNNDK